MTRPNLSLHCYNVGDWINGKREGRGIETAEYGSYNGGWRFDMKHGHGEEQTTVRTIFNGQWERGRKHGSGERKIAYGLIEAQVCQLKCIKMFLIAIVNV